jgi:hypothetical protein
MQKRLLLGLAAFAMVLAPCGVRADDQKAPSIVIRLKSIDGLLKDVRYIGGLAGQAEQLKQLDEVLKMYSTKDGLQGVDIKRPIGMYGSMTAGLQDSPAVVLLPIADEKVFTDFLGTLPIKVEKDKDGVYSIENIPNVPLPIFLRFANKYAYITVNDKENIAKNKLLLPEKVLPADDAVLAISAGIGDLPDIAKQIALGQVENLLAGLKAKEPNEPEWVTKFKEKALDVVADHIKAILNDGEQVSVRIAVNEARDDISVDLAFKAKEGSALAKELASVGAGKSLFAGLAGKEDAIRVIASVMLPDEIKKLIGPAVDDLAKQLIEHEKDQVKQALMKAAIERIVPTVKAGEIDAGVFVRGPDGEGHFTAVGGLKVKEGKGIDGFLRDFVKNIPDKDKGKVTLDVDSAGEMKIHKALIDEMDADAKKVFGSGTVYLGISDDRILLGLGPDALKAVKSAAEAAPGSAPGLSAMVSMSRAANLEKKEPQPPKIAREVFGASPDGNDTVTVRGQPGPSSNLSIRIKGKVIQFVARTSGNAAAGAEK